MSGETPVQPSNVPAPNGAAIADRCRLREEVTPADREGVRELVTRTGFFRPDEINVAVELVDNRLARGNDSPYAFLFAESGEATRLESELIGYACFGPIACTQGSYDLYWIAVDPRFQRQGLGRRLLTAAESRIAAAGGRRIYVDTSGRPQYAPTRAFYERQGYTSAARLTDFYAPGDDRVIYVKVIG